MAAERGSRRCLRRGREGERDSIHREDKAKMVDRSRNDGLLMCKTSRGARKRTSVFL